MTKHPEVTGRVGNHSHFYRIPNFQRLEGVGRVENPFSSVGYFRFLEKKSKQLKENIKDF